MTKKLKLFLVGMVIITILITILVSQNVIFSATKTTKIMPLGDSITAIGNWRQLLLSKLTSSGYNVEFVGTQQDNYTKHEGHSGYSAINLGKSGELATWLSSTNPDIVLMHLGTNDCWGSNRMTTEIIDGFTALVGQMRANNPNMIIMAAKILPMYPSGSGETANNNVIDLNSSIDGWAKGLTTSQSPIIVVDQYTGFNPSTDAYDGVHENDSGSIKISDKWFAALKNILSPSTTATIPPTQTTTIKPSALVTTPPSFVLGDVNGDGKITSTDASLVERHILGSSTLSGSQFTAADTNKDGKLSSTDVSLIERYLLGLISSF